VKVPAFSGSAFALLAASALILGTLSLWLSGSGGDGPSDQPGRRSSGPSSYSISALGYAGCYDTLHRLGRTVRRGLNQGMVSQGAVIVAEPNLGYLHRPEFASLLKAPRLLLVLPKWLGRPDPERRGWIAQAEPRPLAEAQQTLALVDSDAQVFRQPGPQTWPINEIGPTPTVSPLAQLMRSEAMRPLVATDHGLLLGEIEADGGVIWVLSDPDLLANHGLIKGDNGAFMLALIDKLRGWRAGDLSAPIVFEETVHGYQPSGGSSPWGLIFRFPLVVVTALAGATAILLALAGSRRFGAPRPGRPPLDYGQAGLIANSARLLDYAGHQAEVLQRYLSLTVRSAGRSLHAPPGLDDAALAAWLDKVGRSRGLRSSGAAILQTVNSQDDSRDGNLSRLLADARAIYRWKREILNGYETSRRHN
jgi:hypothetical protein